MKKAKFLMFMIAAAAVTVFTGCGGDGDEPTPETSPTITMTVGGTDRDATPGETLTFAWDARKHPEGKDLDIISITLGTANIAKKTNKGYSSGAALSNADQKQYVDTLVVSAETNAGTYNYTFEVTDGDGKTAEETVTITVVAPKAVTSHNDKVMGAQSASAGGAFASSSGMVFSTNPSNTPAADQATVDFIYYFETGAGTGILGSPDDATFNSTYYPGNLGSWTNKNSTMFKTTSLTKTEFDLATTDLAVNAVYDNAGTTATTKVNVAQGDVISFITGAGKKGLLLIESISTGANGSITIDVKVAP